MPTYILVKKDFVSFTAKSLEQLRDKHTHTQTKKHTKLYNYQYLKKANRDCLLVLIGAGVETKRWRYRKLCICHGSHLIYR